MITATPRDYSLIAPVYDHVFNKPLGEGHREIGALIKRMNKKGMKILEVGVGSGLTFGHMPRGVEFTGIDINEKMLSMARKKAHQQRGKKITLENMNAEKMTFRAGQYDLVLAPSVITAVDSPLKCMKEIIRVTKKGGYIAVIANLRNDSIKSRMIKFLDPLTKKYLGFRTDIDLHTFDQLKQLEIIECKQINNLLGFPLSTYLLFRKK
jgi:phosphatidylethanolamine/phosphatidyl-N-methylethanolamine N-methyltransferase